MVNFDVSGDVVSGVIELRGWMGMLREGGFGNL